MQPAQPLARTFRLTPLQQKALGKLGIHTVGDLLRHLPARYETIEEVRSTASLAAGEKVVVYGMFSQLETGKTWKTKKPLAEAWLSDGTGRIKVRWFHQPYLAKMLQEQTLYKVSGTVSGSGGKLYLSNPEVTRAEISAREMEASLFRSDAKEEISAKANGVHTPTLFAVYPESHGVTSRWFRHAVAKAIAAGAHHALEDPLPQEIRARYRLPTLATALVWIHQPRTLSDATAARKRFAFEEIFTLQVLLAQKRRARQLRPSLTLAPPKEAVRRFIARFPFSLTRAQMRAVDTILADLASEGAMARLLEGDVGSGKTAVAAVAVFAALATAPPDNRWGRVQAAYMCPTEILARQQFESFIEYFRESGVRIGLITSSGCRIFPSKVRPDESVKISRAQLLRWVADGTVAALVGTHALIQKSVTFKNLGLVIIDEQHRFGTLQRATLTRKDQRVPHLLSMSATPIPRTLALTLYGDLDLTLLDELPPGRKKVITRLVRTKEEVEAMYAVVRRELAAGRQAYLICPRIEEPDPQKALALQAKSAVEEARRIQEKVFPEFRVGLAHGKLTPAEKEAVMRAFAAHEIDLLVATSVVEVGVNVPNATAIIIEGAERFGLAQLHQLRGRVMRAAHQSYCFAVCTTRGGATAQKRLTAFQKAKNGFALAELDLQLRGPGELYGRAQSGISDIGMEALQNIKLVEAARTEAQQLVARDPSLNAYPALAARVAEKEILHME